MQVNNTGQPVQNNEEAIMYSFREGNKEAFRIVYEQMVRPLNHFVVNIIKSEHDAEDIVANAFYKLFHARDGMTTFEHVKRWLFVIVRNEAIDWLRLKHRQRESQADLPYLDDGVEDQVETEKVRAVLIQDIHKEIEKLPRQRRTILQLYFFEEKNTSEIADILQLSPQTVLNHKTKALDSLRKSGLRMKWLTDGVPTFAITVVAATFYLLK